MVDVPEPPALIAHLELVVISPAGEQRSCVVGVGRPRRQPTGEWGCPTLSIYFPDARLVYGEGSLQALCLGLSFVRMTLEGFLETGGQLRLADDDEPLTRERIAVLFSRVGAPGG